MNKKIEDKLRAAFGNQLAIGSIQKYPRLIDMNIIKKFKERSAAYGGAEPMHHMLY